MQDSVVMRVWTKRTCNIGGSDTTWKYERTIAGKVTVADYKPLPYSRTAA